MLSMGGNAGRDDDKKEEAVVNYCQGAGDNERKGIFCLPVVDELVVIARSLPLTAVMTDGR